MDWSVAIVAFVAFFGGLLLVSRVTAWISGVVLFFKPDAADRGGPAALSLVQIFLHSGLWSLLIAIAAIYYVASLADPAWLWAVVGGLSLAVALLAVVVALSYWRQHRGAATPTPLTPERLLKIRGRFFWGMSLYFGGTLAASMLYLNWQSIGHSAGLVAWVIAVCVAGGYVCSWFLWQWVGASLQAREDARRRAERNNAV